MAKERLQWARDELATAELDVLPPGERLRHIAQALTHLENATIYGLPDDAERHIFVQRLHGLMD